MAANEDILPVLALTEEALQPILAASLNEGYKFIKTLWDEYVSGKTRFDADGAALYGVYNDGTLVAIGGVHRDPYLDRPNIGRIRHVYVMPEARRNGVGRRLMTALINHSRGNFAFLTLRTPTEHADAFYVSVGFSREPRFEQATHWLSLEE
jgi:GNAT superfamily N-acetyltransferase